MSVKNPNIIIPIEVVQYDAYLKWHRTLESGVWMCLLGYIIRSVNANTGGLDLYNRFFIGQKKLVSRWSLADIAKKIGSEKSSISKALKRLEKKGFIKIHKIRRGKVTVNVYELGKVDFENDVQIIYGWKEWKKMAAAHKIAGFRLSSEQPEPLSSGQLYNINYI